MTLKVCHVLFASGNAAYPREILDIAVCAVWKTTGYGEEDLMKETCITIMILYPPIAWPVLSALAEPAAGTRNMQCPKDRNLDIKIWQSFIMPAHLTVFTARIITLKGRHSRPSKYRPRTWPLPRIDLHHAYAISEGIPVHRSSMPSRLRSSPENIMIPK